MKDFLDFEKPLHEIDERIEKLKKTSPQKQSIQRLIRMLLARRTQLERELYQDLSPWQRTQIARHPLRPSTLDYLGIIAPDFLQLHGDRMYGDDQAILGGFGHLGKRSVMFVGQEKGKTLKERTKRNFGMANPEGYRKALRLMKLAEKFHRPIIAFIDTPGAYPGIEAEQRGQAEAIARNLMVMARLRVPIVTVIIGEGGSGGALALGVADRVVMCEHSIYSVISPEGCAAILWGNASKATEAATALKMTANELLGLGIVDEIVPEPFGGAHRDSKTMADNLSQHMERHLITLERLPIDTLLSQRDEKYRRMESLTSLDTSAIPRVKTVSSG